MDNFWIIWHNEVPSMDVHSKAAKVQRKERAHSNAQAAQRQKYGGCRREAIHRSFGHDLVGDTYLPALQSQALKYDAIYTAEVSVENSERQNGQKTHGKSTLTAYIEQKKSAQKKKRSATRPAQR